MTYGQKEFVEQLTIGSSYAEYVAKYLNDRGVFCEATPMRVAQTPEEIKEFTENDKDITFKYLPGNLEVKSRNIGLSANLKYVSENPMFVDTVSGWAQKKETPRAVVTISQVTKHMAVIPVESKEHWTTLKTYDKRRGYSDTFYMVDKSCLKTIDWLIEQLLEEQEQYL